MCRLMANFYESGEEAGKLLARLLKRQETASAIPGIRGNNGKIVTSAKEFNQVFMDFYKTLYTSDTVFSPDKLKTFSSRVSPQNNYSIWKHQLERRRLGKLFSQCSQVKLQG